MWVPPEEKDPVLLHAPTRRVLAPTCANWPVIVTGGGAM